MKIAYFDCFSGISGDMILGALIDLGFDQKTLMKHLSKLKLTGYEIEILKEQRGPITGTRVNIKVDQGEHSSTRVSFLTRSRKIAWLC
jgi:uncharacterized protein (DUF111 family)